MWWIPILGGEFILDRRFGFTDGLMGGNLWFFGKTVESALEAAEKGVEAILPMPNVITTFPGGIAGSGSKAGSDCDFTIASTYEKFCPMLQNNPDMRLDCQKSKLSYGNYYEWEEYGFNYKCHKLQYLFQKILLIFS